VILIAGFQAIRSVNVRNIRAAKCVRYRLNHLCRRERRARPRFITTPLERAIAAADGIDYIESSSRLGASTITIRLKLNYDANKALAEISSKWTRFETTFRLKPKSRHQY